MSDELKELELPEIDVGYHQYYRCGSYYVLGVAAHSETDELFVVYIRIAKDQNEPHLRICPIALWPDKKGEELSYPAVPCYPSGLYRHKKGGLYQVLGVAAEPDAKELFMVYVALATDYPGPRIRVRPLNMWDDDVEWPDGKLRPRFIYVGYQIPVVDVNDVKVYDRALSDEEVAAEYTRKVGG